MMKQMSAPMPKQPPMYGMSETILPAPVVKLSLQRVRDVDHVDEVPDQIQEGHQAKKDQPGFDRPVARLAAPERLVESEAIEQLDDQRDQHDHADHDQDDDQHLLEEVLLLLLCVCEK
jgi:hypothetical protein